MKVYKTKLLMGKDRQKALHYHRFEGGGLGVLMDSENKIIDKNNYISIEQVVNCLRYFVHIHYCYSL